MRVSFARLAACAVALLAFAEGGCGYRTRRDVQRDYARTQLPAPLAPRAATAAPARPLAVRVLVDEDYRSEILRWSDRVQAQIARANQVLEPQFGVRLVVKELRPWSRTGRGKALGATLADLEAEEPGGDVDWVVGFVSSTGMISGAPEQIGMARYFGTHLVLRGMVDSAEGERYRRTLDALPEAERDALLRERELHRETAVFLHEWAHTLGAIHEKDPESLLNPHYAPTARAFSATSARIVALGLEQRASRRAGTAAAWAAAYRDAIEGARAYAWDTATIDAALATAAALEGAGAKPPTAARPAPTDVVPVAARAADVAALLEADTADRMGDPKRAAAIVEPVAARLHGHRKLQSYACHLRRRAGQTFAARDPCREKRALEPRAAPLLFAEVLADEGDRAAALDTLARAEASLAAARPPAPRKDWAALAAGLAWIDACTAAERAAARAPAEPVAREASARCARTRRHAALPASGSRVDPAREPEYVEAVLRARASAQAGRAAPARAGAAAIEAAFPGSPGGPLVRCLAEAQSGDPRAARAACEAADAAAPWAPEPPHVLGLMAGDEGRWADARAQLVRAMERDPEDRSVWPYLATAHRKLGDTAAYEALRARHKQKFGFPLAPAW